MNKKPKLLTFFDWASVILLAVASYLVFFFAPMEAVMGNVQRVFYFHVSMAWIGSIGFLLAMFAGIAYLATKDRKWDIIGVAVPTLLAHSTKIISKDNGENPFRSVADIKNGVQLIEIYESAPTLRYFRRLREHL